MIQPLYTCILLLLLHACVIVVACHHPYILYSCFWHCHVLKIYIKSDYCAGSKALTLTSIPVSESENISACSGTTVIVTCSATQVGGLKWTHLPGSRIFTLIDNGTTAVIAPYTVSLVNATARNKNLADLVSVLEVMINDLRNGTTITCQALPNMTSKSLTLFKEGKCLILYCVLSESLIYEEMTQRAAVMIKRFRNIIYY